MMIWSYSNTSRFTSTGTSIAKSPPVQLADFRRRQAPDLRKADGWSPRMIMERHFHTTPRRSFCEISKRWQMAASLIG